MPFRCFKVTVASSEKLSPSFSYHFFLRACFRKGFTESTVKGPKHPCLGGEGKRILLRSLTAPPFPPLKSTYCSARNFVEWREKPQKRSSARKRVWLVGRGGETQRRRKEPFYHRGKKERVSGIETHSRSLLPAEFLPVSTEPRKDASSF